MEQLIACLITGLCTLIPVIVGFLVTFLKYKKLKFQVNEINEVIKQSDKDLYIECPICHSKVYLKKVEIKADE